MNRSAKYNQRPKSGIITLTDFMRIQKAIIPSKNSDQNREEYDKKWQTQNQFHKSNFPEVIKNNQKEIEKDKFIKDELRKRQWDELERRYVEQEKEIVNNRAKRKMFHDQDDIKTFNSQLLVADALKEREFQQDINKQKKEMEKEINRRYYEMEIQQMNDYDKNEMLKAAQEKEKRNYRMKIIDEQVKEQKIKRIKEYQEKKVEGILIKKSIKDGLEEDKKKAEKAEQFKLDQRDEFIHANECLQQVKQERLEKEKAAEREIEKYSIKKQQIDDMKKKVEKEKFDEKQKARQKIIDAQIENLNKMQKNNERILQKQIKEAEEKKEKEEAIKQKRIKEQREQMWASIAEKRKEKEDKKIENKKDEQNFWDNWKERMKQMEHDEKEEKKQIKERNKAIQKFQLDQMKEKKEISEDEYAKSVKSAYLTKELIQDERDDYMEYVSEWIKEYQKQGKDIKPLIIEINKYRKRNRWED